MVTFSWDGKKLLGFFRDKGPLAWLEEHVGLL